VNELIAHIPDLLSEGSLVCDEFCVELGLKVGVDGSPVDGGTSDDIVGSEVNGERSECDGAQVEGSDGDRVSDDVDEENSGQIDFNFRSDDTGISLSGEVSTWETSQRRDIEVSSDIVVLAVNIDGIKGEEEVNVEGDEVGVNGSVKGRQSFDNEESTLASHVDLDVWVDGDVQKSRFGLNWVGDRARFLDFEASSVSGESTGDEEEGQKDGLHDDGCGREMFQILLE
jgi:hypothetical protein